MDRKTSYRCPRCGKALIRSDLPEYAFQCMDCDEDFYTFEAITVVASISTPTEYDQKTFSDVGLCVDLNVRTKLTVSSQGKIGYCFIESADVERLGLDYISDHVALHYSKALNEWYVKLSQNDYYNDPKRNPEKVIPVCFVGIEEGTGREVYKGVESERYYLRDVSRREPFAKWLICGKRRVCDDGDEPKANLIFKLGDQTEKVTYDDWNGVCAYSNTFNPNFRN